MNKKNNFKLNKKHFNAVKNISNIAKTKILWILEQLIIYTSKKKKKERREKDLKIFFQLLDIGPFSTFIGKN